MTHQGRPAPAEVVVQSWPGSTADGQVVDEGGKRSPRTICRIFYWAPSPAPWGRIMDGTCKRVVAVVAVRQRFM